VVPVGLFLLNLLDGDLQLLDVLLDGNCLLLQALFLRVGFVALLLHLGQPLLRLGQLDLQVSALGRALGLPLVILGQVALLRLDLLEQGALLILDGAVLVEELGLQVDLLGVGAVLQVGLLFQDSQLLSVEISFCRCVHVARCSVCLFRCVCSYCAPV
jgi:hypothetical protein